MIITNCPRCGSMNATTTCTKCGWSQLTKSTVSTCVLLDYYKRLLLENRNLKERVAELEATVEIHTDISNAYEKRISKIVSLSNKANAKLQARIAELEGKIDQLTAHSDIERQDDKCSKPEPNVCEACGGDGTVLLRDGYGGQVIATAKCIYCNGIGRVNKERER